MKDDPLETAFANAKTKPSGEAFDRRMEVLFAEEAPAHRSHLPLLLLVGTVLAVAGLLFFLQPSGKADPPPAPEVVASRPSAGAPAVAPSATHESLAPQGVPVPGALATPTTSSNNANPEKIVRIYAPGFTPDNIPNHLIVRKVRKAPRPPVSRNLAQEQFSDDAYLARLERGYHLLKTNLQ